MTASSPIQAFSNEHSRHGCFKSNFPLFSRVQLTSLTGSPITSSMQNLALAVRVRASKMVIMSKQSPLLYKFYSTTDIMTLDILVW